MREDRAKIYYKISNEDELQIRNVWRRYLKKKMRQLGVNEKQAAKWIVKEFHIKKKYKNEEVEINIISVI